MAYENLGLQPGAKFKAAHVAHMEEGIGQAHEKLAVLAGGEERKLRIQVFGTSISCMQRWSGTPSWPDLLPGLLPYEVEIVNSAVGGNTLIRSSKAVGDLPEIEVQKINGCLMKSSDAEGIAYIDVFSHEKYWLNAYSVTAGTSYRIYGTDVKLAVAQPMGMFASALEDNTTGQIIISDDGTVDLTNSANTLWSPDFVYTPASDGYIVIATSTDYAALSLEYADADALVDTIYKGICWQTNLEETTTGIPEDGTGYAQYDPVDTACDVFIIEGGPNDWGGMDRDITGDRSSLNLNTARAAVPKNTLYGAVRHIVENIQTRCPGSSILFLTPGQRYNDKDMERTSTADGELLNAEGGMTLRQVADVIVDACGYYGVGCLDMYRESGFNRFNFCVGSDYSADGLHPSPEGQARIARLVAGKLRAMLG